MKTDLAAVLLIALGAGGIGYALVERALRRASLRELFRPVDTRPLWQRMQSAAEWLFPPEVVAERLERAGTPWGMTPPKWALARLAALAGAPLLMLAVAPNVVGLMLGVIAGVLGPDFVLDQLADDRRKRIAARVPLVADLTAAVAAAGAPSVAHALQRVLDDRHEFDQIMMAALREADTLGVEAALRRAAEKGMCEEARTLCATLAQAHSLGTGAADVLRAQAKQIHSLRASAKKAHVEKARTYLTVITVVFMFVPLFIVALLPAWGTITNVF